MRLVLSFLLAFTGILAASAARADELDWETYVNSRFGFSVDIPAGFLLPLPPPPNGDGLGFENAERTVAASVFGAMNALELTFDEYYQGALDDPQLGRVTYKRKTDRWFVLSGYRTAKGPDGPQEVIFYQRLAIDDAGEAISGLNIVFPPAMKQTMDPIVTRMSRSLTPPKLPER